MSRGHAPLHWIQLARCWCSQLVVGSWSAPRKRGCLMERHLTEPEPTYPQSLMTARVFVLCAYRPSSCVDHWIIGKVICVLCAWSSCVCIDYSNSNLFLSAPQRRSKRSSADPFVVLLNKSDRNNPCKPYKDLATHIHVYLKASPCRRPSFG